MTSPLRFRMKKPVLALAVLGSVISGSLTASAYDDRRDHDWNDDYWHHHHYGYWHGQRGYWRYHDHGHEFIRVGPDLGHPSFSAGRPQAILINISWPNEH